jgi:hypothetical protein
MSEIEIPNPQDALIAYFDILGYQEFLANNTPEQAAEKVLKTLLGLEHTIPSGFT